MTRPRYDADDPREWLARARSALAHAQQSGPEVLFEDLCYSAQQAAEKAIKAVFVRRGQAFPFTHNLDRLLELLRRAGVPVPDEVAKAGTLTPYALEVRYPGLSRETTEEDYREALSTAEAVVRWAEAVVLAPEG
ncbi:MAG: HEPN domain-containing protein [Acidobacteria bacterium]|nr:HEPN domain-containing protein [Acidobacteriota bacterium]